MKSRILTLTMAVACAPAASDRGEDATSTTDSAGPAPSAVAASAAECVVDSTGIGGARLGATLDDARRALPLARLERTEDGDGVQLVAVHVDTTRLMVMNAHEDDTEIDWSKEIRSIETFHPSCRTRSGVHPGALVTDVERILGGVERIVLSEIESREYVTFANQPEWLTLRLNYTGVFPEGSRETTQHRPGARIFSMAVSR